MKLYAIRDKLLDYYLRPFTAGNDKEVMASLAQEINNDQNKAPIAQTPSHFEIWSLAEVDGETGIVVPKKEFLGDASQLVRPNIRETVDGRRAAIHQATGGQPRPSRHAAGNGGAHPGAAQGAAQAEDSQGAKTPGADPGSPGGNEGNELDV